MKSSLADWLKVGHIKKAHGIRGELFLFLSAGSADWYSKQSLGVLLLAPHSRMKNSPAVPSYPSLQFSDTAGISTKPGTSSERTQQRVQNHESLSHVIHTDLKSHLSPYPLAELLKHFYEMRHDQKIEFEKIFKAQPLLLGHIQKLKPHGNGFILQLKEITQRTPAEWLQGYHVYISKSLLQSEGDEKPFLAEFLDTPVIVHNRQIGTITGFSSNGAQDILIVTAHSDPGSEVVEYEIPLVESWVKEAKLGPSGYLVLELPEGLLEINQRRTKSKPCG